LLTIRQILPCQPVSNYLTAGKFRAKVRGTKTPSSGGSQAVLGPNRLPIGELSCDLLPDGA
jgi:hypothetical protein